MKILRLIQSIVGLLNPRTWGPFTETFQVSKFDHGLSVSWAQAGEDLALVSILGQIPNGKYLDIGAHHPSRFSVTRALYQRGWRGINVDANNDLLPKFEEDRPLDLNLNYCVGDLSEYQIAIFEEPAISTVSKEWQERFLNERQVIREFRTVRGISLKRLVTENFREGQLTFLNIDIEGADFDALLSLNLPNLNKGLWPLWVMVETAPPVHHALSTASVSYLVSHGYSPFLVLPNACLLRLIQN
jgi:FkbM family methyltransferase